MAQPVWCPIWRGKKVRCVPANDTFSFPSVRIFPPHAVLDIFSKWSPYSVSEWVKFFAAHPLWWPIWRAKRWDVWPQWYFFFSVCTNLQPHPILDIFSKWSLYPPSLFFFSSFCCHFGSSSGPSFAFLAGCYLTFPREVFPCFLFLFLYSQKALEYFPERLGFAVDFIFSLGWATGRVVDRRVLLSQKLQQKIEVLH